MHQVTSGQSSDQKLGQSIQIYQLIFLGEKGGGSKKVYKKHEVFKFILPFCDVLLLFFFPLCTERTEKTAEMQQFLVRICKLFPIVMKIKKDPKLISLNG